MTEKIDLLNTLRIDRQEAQSIEFSSNGYRARWPRYVIIATLVLLGGTSLFIWFHSNVVTVKAVAATPIAQGAAATPTSILDASGYVVAMRQATVSAKTTGKLENLYVEEGQRVKKGDVLASLDDSNARAALGQQSAKVLEAETAVRAAETALRDASPTFRRSEHETVLGLVSSATLEREQTAYDEKKSALALAKAALAVERAQLSVAQQDEDDTIIRAPYTGVLTRKNAQPGEIISPLSAGGAFTRTGIGTLVDMDSLAVEVEVSENFISLVHAGGRASLRLNAYPNWTIPASVITIIPSADRSKATVKVRVGFNTRDPRILPEMGAKVSFLDSNGPAIGSSYPAIGVVVPPEAVSALYPRQQGVGVVFVIATDRVERRQVRLGDVIEGGRVVISGLSVGERVAVEGSKPLQNHQEVKVLE